MLGLQHRNLGEHTSACDSTPEFLFSSSSCVSGLITNCTSWPCEEGEEGAQHLTVPPDCSPPGAQWGAGGKEVLCPGQRLQPALTPSSLSAFPSSVPQVGPRGPPGPPGASAQPPVAPPNATGTASAPGPPRQNRPSWGCHPHRPCLHLFAPAPKLRKSPASWQRVTVSPVAPSVVPSRPVDTRCLAPAAPGPGQPLPQLLPLLSPQELGAGVLGGPGPAAAGAAGEACGAGCEPVTSPRPRAWGITARGLGPRERPARLCRAQVPARNGAQGSRNTVGGGGGHPHSSQPPRPLPQWPTAPPFKGLSTVPVALPVLAPVTTSW